LTRRTTGEIVRLAHVVVPETDAVRVCAMEQRFAAPSAAIAAQ
jgi:hypothetical protein